MPGVNNPKTMITSTCTSNEETDAFVVRFGPLTHIQKEERCLLLNLYFLIRILFYFVTFLIRQTWLDSVEGEVYRGPPRIKVHRLVLNKPAIFNWVLVPQAWLHRRLIVDVKFAFCLEHWFKFLNCQQHIDVIWPCTVFIRVSDSFYGFPQVLSCVLQGPVLESILFVV